VFSGNDIKEMSVIDNEKQRNSNVDNNLNKNYNNKYSNNKEDSKKSNTWADIAVRGANN